MMVLRLSLPSYCNILLQSLICVSQPQVLNVSEDYEVIITSIDLRTGREYRKVNEKGQCTSLRVVNPGDLIL
jgi:hypothetical protein